MQKTRIDNIEVLRNQTIQAFEMVRDDPRRVAQGKELGNLAGKVISSVKLQLDYASARKEKPDIEFLNGLTNSMKPIEDHIRSEGKQVDTPGK